MLVSRWFRSIVPRLLVGVSLVPLACGAPSPSSPTPASVPGLIKPGSLVFATTGNLPPFTQVDPPSGKVTGYSIDLAELIAKNFGLQLETPTVDFVAELQGLASGQYDIADSAIRPTPERQQQFLFSIPLASAAEVAVVRDSDRDKLSSGISDVKGLRVGANQGAVSESYLLDNQATLGYASYSGFVGSAEAFLALETDRIDLYLADPAQSLYYIKQNPGKAAVVGPQIIPSPYALAMRQGNTGLQTAINPVLVKIVSDGTLAEIQKKWFGACLATPNDINAAAPYPNPPGC